MKEHVLLQVGFGDEALAAYPALAPVTGIAGSGSGRVCERDFDRRTGWGSGSGRDNRMVLPERRN